MNNTNFTITSSSPVWKPLFVIVLVLMLIPTPSHADSKACSVKSTSDAIALLFCPADSVDTDWVAAGKKACGNKEFCNAWIWLDEKNVPVSAPATDAELPKHLIAKASAVWANDSQSLLKLSKAK